MTSKSDEKKQHILKTAMMLFSAKGSSATSMQEIAEACGISKGSIYLHFKSKEELEQSLFIYCYQMLQEHLMQVEQESDLTPKGKMIRQLEVSLDLVLELRGFLIMQLREWLKTGELYHEPEFIQSTNATLLSYSKTTLITAYGEDITPYTADLLMIVQGMLGTYIRILFDPTIEIATHRMASYLVDMLDISADRFLKERPEPLISEEILIGWGSKKNCLIQPERHPLLVIKELKELIPVLTPDSEVRRKAIDSLHILEKEMLELQPRYVILLGMIANLNSIPEIKVPLQELQRLLQPYLISNHH